MSDCKIYPADTVDIYGNVWPTVGENIRNGIYGKLKVAKVKIDGKNITSNDLEVTTLDDYTFKINKKAVLIFIDNAYSGLISLKPVYIPEDCLVVSSYLLANAKADISILYTE